MIKTKIRGCLALAYPTIPSASTAIVILYHRNDFDLISSSVSIQM